LLFYLKELFESRTLVLSVVQFSMSVRGSPPPRSLLRLRFAACAAHPLPAERLTILPHHPSFVNTFFALFCTFFGSPSYPLRRKGFQAKNFWICRSKTVFFPKKLI
jgi:hypothetical protein